MSLAMFGASVNSVEPVVITLTNRTVTHDTVNAATATAGIRFLNTGQFQQRIGSSYSNISGQWATGPVVVSEYTVRYSIVSGPTPSGGMAINTDYALSTSREAYISVSDGEFIGVYDFVIKKGAVTMATGRFTLDVWSQGIN